MGSRAVDGQRFFLVSPVTVPPFLYSGVHLFSECASFPYYMVTESEVMKLSILHLNKMYALCI